MIPPLMHREYAVLAAQAETDERLRTMALHLMAGMLAHPTRYRQRVEDAHLHWHAALAREALDMAQALVTEIDNRRNST